jgi:secreted Zn-dependent insulinase-like peptidase
VYRSQSKYLVNCLLAGKVWNREERLNSLDSISLTELLEFAKEWLLGFPLTKQL